MNSCDSVRNFGREDGVADDEAAGVALVGITAHAGLFRCARLEAGETVFVNGGTGGVGSMVVQMAKAVGAKVIATVGSPEALSGATDRSADSNSSGYFSTGETRWRANRSGNSRIMISRFSSM